MTPCTGSERRKGEIRPTYLLIQTLQGSSYENDRAFNRGVSVALHVRKEPQQTQHQSISTRPEPILFVLWIQEVCV